MKLHNHFLSSDLEQASREFHCTKDLLVEINRNLRHGKIEKAKHLSIDLTKSLHELTKLAEKKINLNRLNYYMKELGTTQVIRRLVHAKDK